MPTKTAGGRKAADRAPKRSPAARHLVRPPGLTWRGYLVQLLHIASSIEHALMVQYLYAAYSLDPNKGKDGTEQQKIADWKNLILSVAKEEMGHLLTVQNVLCLLGGPVELIRDDFPWDSGIQPFDFHLERLTAASLASYVAAEAPEDQSEATQLAKRMVIDARGTVDSKALAARSRRVGQLYTDIIAILGNPDLITDSMFHHDSIRFQASWDDWGRGHVYKEGRKVVHPVRSFDLTVDSGEKSLISWFGSFKVSNFWHSLLQSWKRWRIETTRADVIIERVATRYQAIQALKLIADQGESAQVSQSSHFQRFSLIASEFKAAKEAHKADNEADKTEWEPTHFVANDPYTRLPNAKKRSSGSEITSPDAVKWANLFDLRYQMLLAYLRHTFQLARNGSEAGLRGAVIHRVFGEMYNLKSIAGILVQLPLTDDDCETRRAGPPFQMPYTLALPISAVDRWRLHRDLIAGAAELIRALMKAPGSDAARPYLQAMKDLDGASVDWIDQVLAGLTRDRALTS